MQLVPDVLELLQSTERRDVAWGAHLAGEHDLREVVPELRRTLLQCQTENRIARLLLIDALARLGAEFTVREATSLDLDLALEPSLAILARNPNRHSGKLREVFDAHATSRRGHAWVAAGNLLAATRARGFAHEVLSKLSLRIQVTVTDPGAEPRSVGVGFGGGAAGGMRAIRIPPGYPPIPSYDLLLVPKPGDFVLAEGPKSTVFSRRRAAVRRTLRVRIRNRRYRSGVVKLGWLEQMAGENALGHELRLDAWRTTEFVDAETYERDLRVFAAEQEAAFQDFADRLRAARVMTEEERARIRPSIRFVIHDARQDSASKLPNPPEQNR